MSAARPLVDADGRRPVSLREVAAFDRRYHTPIGQRWSTIAVIVAIYLVVQTAFIAVILPAAGLGPELERRVFAGVAVVTALYSGFVAALIWRNVSRRVRVVRLADANGFHYSAREPLSQFAGSIASLPRRRFAVDSVGPGLDPIIPDDFAAATFARSSGFRPRSAGLVQLALERPTPHIVLANRRAGVLRDTGSRIRSGQILRLEGDFNDTFTLYCPAGYERDALYVFTPDLMALLLDVAADCEVELIDGWLVAYVGGPWRLWRARDFAALVALVDALGAKARRQTRRYSDDRSPTGGVAASGRRLRLRPSAGSVLSLIAPVALGILGLVSRVTG